MSFRRRTMFYRNRKRLKEVRLKLDWTKRRHGILKDAIDPAKEHPDLDYVFADVNCHLKVVFKDSTSNFFNDIDNLKSMINNRSSVMRQFMFRPGDSCVQQLLSITNDIYKSFDANPSLEVRGIFLYMSKAFDRVWHEGLLFKLKGLGLSGKYY